MLACDEAVRNFPETSEPPTESTGQRQLKRGHSRMERRNQVIHRKSKVFVMNLVKQKKPNRKMPYSPEGGRKRMVGSSAFPTNPEKGCSDERKINMYTIRVHVDR